MHQGNIRVHTPQWNLQFDRFVAKEKELLDMLYLNGVIYTHPPLPILFLN
jgi:hypothetical protein